MSGNRLRRRFADMLTLRTVLATSTAHPATTRLERSSTYLRMIFCVAALCWATPEATAGGSLPPATYSSSENGIASADDGGLPSPYAYATATGGFLASSASASVTYSFEVIAPTNSVVTSVPLEIATFVKDQITGSLTVEYLPGEYLSTSASVALGRETLNSVSAGFGSGGPLAASSSKVSDVSVAPGTVYQISVSVNATISYINGVTLAFADPVISFAPGFDSTGMTLQFSPGIGNSAVPEPSTLVMSSIVLGMFGVAWAYRQLQRTRAAA